MTGIAGVYRWLGPGESKPRLVAEALRLMGVIEGAGASDNPTIMAWADEIGPTVTKTYYSDAIPWCGLFMAVVARRAGKTIPEKPLWALNWAKFGVAADRPSLGDVLVFRRGSGGHVGLYVGEDDQAYHVLGGNQSDRVCIMRIARSRLHAARRPAYRNQPVCVAPCRVAASGTLSANEG